MNIAHENHVEVVGNIPFGDLRLSIEPPYGAFCRGTIAVERLSGTVDHLPVCIPEKVFDEAMKADRYVGDALRLTGEIRTYNKMIDGKARLIIYLYAHKIENSHADDENRVNMTGNICKPPIYRLTPFGREITDLLLAINRGNGKTDYIPCITWGSGARRAREWKVGDTVELTGRFQSREYDKLLPDGSHETRTAYEVSASHINKKEG